MGATAAARPRRRNQPLRNPASSSHLGALGVSLPNSHPSTGASTPNPAHPPTTTPSSRLSQSQAPAGSLCLNVLSVAFGKHLITPWYPSLYREELVTGEPVSRLFVCERCFRYSNEVVLGLAHRRFCEYADDVPGRVVYHKGRYSLYEVDGEEHQLFTQNLSLFSKLFIENKSVCFDVTTFLYYLLVDNDPSTPTTSSATPKSKNTGATNAKVTKKRTSSSSASTSSPNTKPRPTRAGTNRPSQIVGFFSKEKLSWDNNNLACILVFPPWLRLGLGQMLMGASYELARREGRLGGPERPLSTLGAKSYTTYWQRAVARALLAAPNKSHVTIGQLSEATYMIPGDVVGALCGMEGVLGSSYVSKSKAKPKTPQGQSGVGEHKGDGGGGSASASAGGGGGGGGGGGQKRVRVDKGMVRAWLASNGVVDGERGPIDLDGFVDELGEDGDYEGAVDGEDEGADDEAVDGEDDGNED